MLNVRIKLTEYMKERIAMVGGGTSFSPLSRLTPIIWHPSVGASGSAIVHASWIRLGRFIHVSPVSLATINDRSVKKSTRPSFRRPRLHRTPPHGSLHQKSRLDNFYETNQINNQS